ncbi:membrane protein DedA, SNARE-associated domain [Actinopolyspora xinjiangensis]|uniref:Membrane protein DedA, SNARE-associated domain n=1 Tax=Actinopolyspora xinjiangensis TaxID=405564 RepID=A0A1H0WHJ3_9ACTN|nr:DedA family protein [Actinopolyspora xinjiangensis]SDP90011.1 membrane protein DedA, SNARE-associated domain [Actinopolyspora xinjiangensis]
MSLVSDVLDTLSSLPDGLLLTVAGTMAFVESGLGLGMFIPGETGVLIASASVDNRALLGVMLLVVTVMGSGGDHIGYLLGRRYGPAMRSTSIVRRMGVRRWDQATAALDRHGGAAIFLTRLVPIVRTFTPAAAGVSQLRYNRFLAASLSAAALWSLVYVCTGALARASLERVGAVLGNASWVVFGALAVGTVTFLLVRRARTHGKQRSTDPGGSAEAE